MVKPPGKDTHTLTHTHTRARTHDVKDATLVWSSRVKVCPGIHDKPVGPVPPVNPYYWTHTHTHTRTRTHRHKNKAWADGGILMVDLFTFQADLLSLMAVWGGRQVWASPCCFFLPAFQTKTSSQSLAIMKLVSNWDSAPSSLVLLTKLCSRPSPREIRPDLFRRSSIDFLFPDV